GGKRHRLGHELPRVAIAQWRSGLHHGGGAWYHVPPLLAVITDQGTAVRRNRSPYMSYVGWSLRQRKLSAAQPFSLQMVIIGVVGLVVRHPSVGTGRFGTEFHCSYEVGAQIRLRNLPVCFDAHGGLRSV